MNETIRLLMERKSVRQFVQEPMPREDVETILSAAVQAPSAGNMTLWTIINVTDPEKKLALSKSCDNQPFIAKAQLVLVRTNLLRKIQEAGEDHTISEAQLSEVYMEPELQRRKFGSEFETFWERLIKAGEDTEGWILTFEGEPVEAAYHLVSSGRTRMGSEVLDGEYPYLQPVECAEDRYAKDYLMRKEISGEEWRATLEAAGYYPDAELQIAVRDASGYVCRIKLGEQVL